MIGSFCLLAALAVPAGGWVKEQKAEASFGVTVPVSYALRGAVYSIPENSTALPDFARLKPLGYVYTCVLDVPKRFFQEGMPGITDRIEWFAIDYEGSFWIEKPGRYRFSLTSDDGSRLYIDGKIVIDNDGVHETLTLGGGALLEAGRHHMRVSYFQGPRHFVALVLEVAPPGGDFAIFDMRQYKPKEDAKPSDPDSRPTIRRDATFQGSAALKGYEVPAFEALKSRPHAFEFRSAAFRFPAADSSSTCVLAFEVPGTAPTAEPGDPGKKRLHMVLLGLVKDAAGRVIEKVSEDIHAEVTDQKLAALRADTLAYAYPVTLVPGRYTVEAVALDRVSGRASTGAFEIDNPERKGIALSSLVLSQRTEPASTPVDPDAPDPLQHKGERIVPAIEAGLPGGTQPSVFFVAYPNKANAAPARVGVQFLSRGEVLASRTIDLPAADAAGAVPMTIAAIDAPGSYELRIKLVQGAESVERSIRYSIAAR